MKLHHVAITVKDLDVSISFYCELFGMQEMNRFRRDDMGATGVILKCENANIELWQFDKLQEGVREGLEFTGIRHIAFTTENVEEAYNKFVAKGISCEPVKTGASGGKYFFFTDPDGNSIEIYKPKE